MASLTIRNISEATKDALKQQALKHHRSMEAEARQIIEFATKSVSGPELAAFVRALDDDVKPEDFDEFDASLASIRREDRSGRRIPDLSDLSTKE